jgi:Holliday junction resolvase RusA-like endonuclease
VRLAAVGAASRFFIKNMKRNKKIEIFVPIKPLPKQSYRHKHKIYIKNGKKVRKNLSYTNERIVNHAEYIRWFVKQYVSAHYRGFRPFSQFVGYELLEFIYEPLKSMKRATVDKIKNGGLVYKTTRPDFENLEKQLNDALQGVLFTDDSIISRKNNLYKRFGESAGIHFIIMGR